MLLLGFANAPALAQRGQEAPATGVLALLPSDSVTEHTLDVGGEKLAYTATAGTYSLFDQNGERSAAIFYTAYTLKGAEPGTRPVTFVFNGGPGASSAYLHLGVVGPRVVNFSANGDAADARLHDNPDTWLKFTDLVLIDPVGAGWSRAAKADKAGDFWGVEADASSLAKVIALYTAKNSRAASPKYLLGESYGGFRSVKVARALQEDQGILVNGIVMLSPFLEGRLQFAANRFPLGAALQLPSLAAAALDRKGSFTPEALAAAERFALSDYLTALAGKPLEGEAAKALLCHALPTSAAYRSTSSPAPAASSATPIPRMPAMTTTASPVPMTPPPSRRTHSRNRRRTTVPTRCWTATPRRWAGCSSAMPATRWASRPT